MTKLSEKADATLFLIREELKSRKLFNVLHMAGLDDCCFQVHLDRLILYYLGLDDGTDETFSIYTNIMDKRSDKIEGDYDSITKQAFKAYTELLSERKKQKQ